jgi:hypothetical protein
MPGASALAWWQARRGIAYAGEQVWAGLGGICVESNCKDCRQFTAGLASDLLRENVVSIAACMKT